MVDKIKNFNLLIAEDDADDRLMIAEALNESHFRHPFEFVVDGQDLMDYLLKRGQYAASDSSSRPGVILLDLNMPKKDGLECLAEIKNHPHLCDIPVVILATSKAEEDIFKSYSSGVNSFITKPVSFGALVEILEGLSKYWFEIVELPPPKSNEGVRS